MVLSLLAVPCAGAGATIAFIVGVQVKTRRRRRSMARRLVQVM